MDLLLGSLPNEFRDSIVLSPQNHPPPRSTYTSMGSEREINNALELEKVTHGDNPEDATKEFQTSDSFRLESQFCLTTEEEAEEAHRALAKFILENQDRAVKSYSQREVDLKRSESRRPIIDKCGIYSYSCGRCNIKYFSEFCMNDHMKMHKAEDEKKMEAEEVYEPGENRHVCYICGSRHKRYYSFARHMQRHLKFLDGMNSYAKKIYLSNHKRKRSKRTESSSY